MSQPRDTEPTALADATAASTTAATRWIEVHVFAGVREAIGRASIGLHVPERCTADCIKKAIAEEYPGIRSLVSSSRIAVGHTFADASVCLELRTAADPRVSLIPPVSGG